ncbi:DUF742 domain-containing protein [Streptomyces aureocirculatus]|uniref:DUF742 domain-containing protein n=1 Tax=Streptomyces aureocirculatus TaxID=67275 RepID=UPI0004C655AB|nr:DUF742 domain-containing protein [Streptomyces aureocirculatus]
MDDGAARSDEGLGAVRPYALVQGRVEPDQNYGLDRSSLVQTVRNRPTVALAHHYNQVLDLCEEPCSVAEIAGRLRRPVNVATIWVSDLLAERLLLPATTGPLPDPDNPIFLRQVLDALIRY